MMKDYLRFEILEHFAANNRLSKAMVEEAFKQHKHLTRTNRYVSHHKPEILKDFELLTIEGSIVEVGTDPGQGKTYGRGRPQRYYKITEYGLKKLIADHRISKTQFWKVLRGYCSNNGTILTLDKLEEFLLIYVNQYVRFRNHRFTLYSDDFLKACNSMFKERIQVTGRISTFQKVLEVLAMNPKIALDNLIGKVNESQSNVKEVLSLYSHRPRSFQDTNIINNDYSKENFDFIRENIIAENQEKGEDLTYELSLFGVMLTLHIILYNDMKKLKHGLYIKKYSLKKYCDKIASNYSQKLPLVFGKWDHLRRILQVSAIYNFDVVLLDDRLANNESNFLSVIMRGNEEIFQGIRKILQYNNSLMQDLLNAGLEVLKDYLLVRLNLDTLERLKDDEDFKKINPVCALLEEIMILLNPLWYRYPRLSWFTFTALDPNRILKYMEESFADEISVFYYMNLLKPNIDVSEMRVYHDPMLRNGSKDLTDNLEKRLLLLIQEVKGDPSIRDWARKWSEDLRSVYQEIGEAVKTWSSSPIFW